MGVFDPSRPIGLARAGRGGLVRAVISSRMRSAGAPAKRGGVLPAELERAGRRLDVRSEDQLAFIAVD